MKILISKALFFITLILLTFSANGQSDYVITVKGDSIPCKISTPLIGSIKYRSATMSESAKIKTDVIKEYYIARQDVLHRSVFKDSSNKPTFMTVIEKGKISLFEMVYTTYNGTMTTTTVNWYVSKGSDNVSDIKTSSLFMFKAKQKRKDDFAEMLKGNKNVYDKYLAEDKFSFKQIQNLVHLYNTGKLFKEIDKTQKQDASNNFNPSQN